MQLILVDDDPISRRLLAAQIRALGYSVTEYEDGQDAWDALQQSMIALVISDWQMPGLDGPGLVQRIRTAEFPGYVYCILITDSGEPSQRGSILEIGADDYLNRPSLPEELRVRLSIASRTLRLEQELRAAQAVLHLSQK
jgi:phosphoserine phosphatase RsbU/P